jgi:hypothetical protein
MKASPLKLCIKLIIQPLQKVDKVLICNQRIKVLILNRALLDFAHALCLLCAQLFNVWLDNLLPEGDGADDQGCDEGRASDDTTADGKPFVVFGPQLGFSNGARDTFYRTLVGWSLGRGGSTWFSAGGDGGRGRSRRSGLRSGSRRSNLHSGSGRNLSGRSGGSSSCYRSGHLHNPGGRTVSHFKSDT